MEVVAKIRFGRASPSFSVVTRQTGDAALNDVWLHKSAVSNQKNPATKFQDDSSFKCTPVGS